MRPRMGVQTGVPAEGPKARGGFPSPPLAASRTLAKQAAAEPVTAPRGGGHTLGNW